MLPCSYCSFWWDSPEGLRTATELIIGSSAPIIGPLLNRLAVMDMGSLWREAQPYLVPFSRLSTYLLSG